jgi:hypothetical protein
VGLPTVPICWVLFPFFPEALVVSLMLIPASEPESWSSHPTMPEPRCVYTSFLGH